MRNEIQYCVLRSNQSNLILKKLRFADSRIYKLYWNGNQIPDRKWKRRTPKKYPHLFWTAKTNWFVLSFLVSFDWESSSYKTNLGKISENSKSLFILKIIFGAYQFLVFNTYFFTNRPRRTTRYTASTISPNLSLGQLTGNSKIALLLELISFEKNDISLCNLKPLKQIGRCKIFPVATDWESSRYKINLKNFPKKLSSFFILTIFSECSGFLFWINSALLIDRGKLFILLCSASAIFQEICSASTDSPNWPWYHSAGKSKMTFFNQFEFFWKKLYKSMHSDNTHKILASNFYYSMLFFQKLC